ncbi:rho GTPase-activating protein SYDE2-like [Myxocyprinus asiaticus]|uniref:rho GTPase-activating protein SYDE2-like n=1 Tax=Myxocyprinus asiaticus TaxID=70543 RepID=UPI002223D401|nr:rho GTPase-activating protein SYDE2-like [Myxocyprinus asiaticus]
MADPLRRTILAKLRGKKAKGKDASTANRPREGKEKVFHRQRERDYISHHMRGKESAVNAIRTADPVAGVGCSAAVRVNSSRADVRRSGGSGPGGPAGVSDQSEVTEMKHFHTQRVRGDSIGFGNCEHVHLRPRGETLNVTDGQDAKTKQTNVTSLQRKAGFKCEQIVSSRGQPNGTPRVFDYIDGNIHDSDLIQVIESSLEYHGDLRMPTLQSPTFFPTELEITGAPGLRDGAPRHHSEDSEDDDYYDNQILPFFESYAQNQMNDKNLNDTEALSVQTLGSGCDKNAQETDRLKMQLKEAYCLLINAMHDISFDGQVDDNGFVDSSESHDSISSRSTADACLSEERGGHRVFDSDLAYFTFPGCHGVGFSGSLLSRSLQSIPDARAKLQRSTSDSGAKYSCVRPSSVQSFEEPLRPAVSGDTAPSRKDALACDASAMLLDGSVSKELVNGPTAPSEIVPEPATHQSCNDAAVAKHPGVTVNKMQEWMLKGRVLSSEMKQRIAGSSMRANRSVQTRPKTSGHANGPQASKHAAAGAQLQSAPMEWVPGSSGVALQEPCTRQTPFNHITVSKKRNWLQQSCARPFLHPENATAPPAAEEDHTHPQIYNIGQPSKAPPRPRRLPLPAASIKPSRISSQPPHRPDPAEENDADDEGEIWYNPIPEDEEGAVPHDVPANREAQMKVTRRVAAGRTNGGAADRRRAKEECVGGEESCRETPQSGVLHSNETFQLHRQMFACKTQEESLAIRATDMSEQSTGGPSPSSSPNPAKRSNAINWSFPDKIKSPRTVRKLSMKMKKLPDLSRKLSIKGNLASSVATSNGQSEPRANGMAELGQSRSRLSPAGVATALASGNVIWRYHLDSSVSTQHNFDKRQSNSAGVPKSASKGGYLSDGDSPELVAKSGKHGTSERKYSKAREQEPEGNGGSPKLPGTELDIDAFRSYSFSEQPKCLTYISGLMSLHFYGAEDLKPPRVDSRNVYCAIQVDSVNKARTALLTCRTAFLDMDHTFNIELENAQHLKLVVFSWESMARRNRVCCHGTVVLPVLFRVRKTHQLAVRLEPRGMIYVKLSLMEQRQNSLEGPDGDHESQVFGIGARRVVEREASGLMVPLLIEKCITEIERRGCQVVGLYRLCGSAAVKKELREAFERDSHTVELSENNYPDINVITGVLKDYLRELPHPLITKQLYESVLDSMAKRPLQIGTCGCENDPADSKHAVSLLEILPEVEKVTLRKLLDHLKRVASHHEVNKMTCQNLAVCFGPVLLSQRQDASSHGNRVFIDSEELASALHFKKHIEVLHYLLQLWPVVDAQGKSPPLPAPGESLPAVTSAVRRRKERPQVLNLTEAEMVGVLRPRAGRLDSPSNRYAGDWSGCQEPYLQLSCPEEAEYEGVPSEEPPNAGQEDLPKGTGDVVSQQELTEEDEGTERVEEMQIEEEESEGEERGGLDRLQVEEELPVSPCDQILPDHEEHRLKEHTYQAYMKIQEISPVLSNRVNLRDLQESIDTLISNLERELNKNKLNVGY